jgi:DeoR/GlpR family transcriptional regulator of sugar metabolism
MLTQERRKIIRGTIEDKGSVKVSDLANEFGVSCMTIRRDLLALSESGFIERIHGGAIALNDGFGSMEQTIVHRINHLTQEKRSIASAAAKLIKSGETIFISAGSTTYWLAQNILYRSNLTVIVNSLIIAKLLSTSEKIEIIVAGGFLRKGELSLVGYLAENYLQDIHVDKVFMGVNGIDPDVGITSTNTQELMTDRSILKLSKNIIVVADHTKFGTISSGRVAPLSMVKTIVTSNLVSPQVVSAIKKQGVEVIQV